MMNFHICSFTDFSDVTLEAGGQVFRFEFSKQFGPLMIGKRGNTIDGVPPQCSPFWRALEAWCKQGHRVDKGGLAVWEPIIEREPRAVCIVGNHYLVVPDSDSRTDEEIRAQVLADVEAGRGKRSRTSAAFPAEKGTT